MGILILDKYDVKAALSLAFDGVTRPLLMMGTGASSSRPLIAGDKVEGHKSTSSCSNTSLLIKCSLHTQCQDYLRHVVKTSFLLINYICFGSNLSLHHSIIKGKSLKYI